MYTSSRPECTRYTKGLIGRGPVCQEYAVNKIDDIFKDSDKKAGLNRNNEDLYSTSYVIPGVKISELASVQQTGRSEFIQTDSDGNMVASIHLAASYSAGNNTCTITSTTMMCEDMQAIITTDTHHSCDYSSGGIISAGGCRGGANIFGSSDGSYEKNITNDFHGMRCKNMMEPVTTTTAIKM